ncbi:MAG TPA: Gfo/Idh/MocA family oxidoreductase [Planctomycetota bacterium]|nr:Gfo/Idh/MocA family oxidoreductase [Planctomycetota bacterium]
MTKSTRRSFLRSSAAAAAGGVVTSALPALPPVHVQGSDQIKIGLVGCGGRGSGAATQALSTKGPVKLVAMGDMFADHLDGALQNLQGEVGKNVDVPAARRFVGFDAIKGVLSTDIDLVILATPPHFRPAHFEAAVAAGKHVFFEKPVAVDAPGVRRVLAANELAKQQRRAVVCGLQRHHQNGYREAIKRVQGGALGRILFARCAWDMGSLWMHPRKQEWSDMEWQLRNWLYFTWLSGDHIVEQHVHNLDVINWALAAHPLKCRGIGGRQVRTDPAFGHIFDHHSVQYQYPGGVWLFSECRQIDHCLNDVSEHLYGADGECHMDGGKWTISGKESWAHDGPNNDPYQTEHDDLFASIRAGKPLNEGQYVAESTLTAIMGRMATYSGKEVTWDQAFNSQDKWGPDKYELGPLPVDPVPMPGRK